LGHRIYGSIDFDMAFLPVVFLFCGGGGLTLPCSHFNHVVPFLVVQGAFDFPACLCSMLFYSSCRCGGDSSGAGKYLDKHKVVSRGGVLVSGRVSLIL